MAGGTRAHWHLLGPAVMALMLGACSSPSTPAPSSSYQAQAMEASQGGDLKTAKTLAEKEIERLSTPELQCSQANSRNCGTLALAYSSLADYQIRSGDRGAGERSFGNARSALVWMDSANRAGATAMVYGDISEAFWKVGDRQRAIAVFEEGRDAGGDSYLYMCSAAAAVRAGQSPPAGRVADAESTITLPISR